MSILRNAIVEKRNILNEIRANNMKLQELRFFSIYLSKINARNINSRVVKFKIDDFIKIMGFEERVKIDYLKSIIDSLLCKIIHVPNEDNGYDAFQLFKKCRVAQDANAEWHIEIDAHDDALPLMFEFKEKYFTYELWNALRLKSSNQIRMYEILKQYENIGERILMVDELRSLIGLSNDEYPRFGDFKYNVLEVCRKALLEISDIKFTYEPFKRGKAGKILSLKFNIEKNEDYEGQLTFDELLAANELENKTERQNTPYEDRIDFLMEACENEFNYEAIELLNDIICKKTPLRPDLETYDYLSTKYKELCYRASKTTVKHRFNYFRKMIEDNE
jgi:plasmid replication initiation protein